MAEPKETSGRTKDAHARSVTLLDPYLLQKLRRYDVIEHERLRAIARDLGSGLEKGAHRLFLVVSAGAVLLTGATFIECAMHVTSGGRGAGQFAHDVLPRLLVCWAGPLFVWRATRRTRLRRVCAVMLQHLSCPHCGYDVRGLPTDPEDGATVCPECGCAWRLNDSQDPGGHDHG